MLNKFFKSADKKQAISWSLYDFANSTVTIIIISFIFPIFFKEVIAGPKTGDFWWGFAVTISTVLGGILTPVIGAISDYTKRKKLKFALFVLLSAVATAGLYFTGPSTLLLGLFLFIILNVFFEIAQTIYDSFLIKVSTKETIGRISGLGWGLGYLGGVIALILLKPLYGGGFEGGFESLYKLAFPLTALFFLIFSIPIFLFLKENKAPSKKEKIFTIIKTGLQKNLKTLKEIKKHKQIFLFLLGWFILNDALVTVFSFVPIYAKTTLALSLLEITKFVIIVQIVGFPSTLFFGWLSDKQGYKKILLLTIFIWTIAVLIGTLATSTTVFYIATILMGLVMGASQATARSWFSVIIPKKKFNEFFGFNGFSSKISAIFGPIIFGTISVLTGNQRIAMASLIPYFLIAFIIFYKIKEKPV